MATSKITRTIAAALSFAALAGCASVPGQQAFNHSAHADIKTIAVLATKPTPVRVLTLNDLTGGYGLVGGLIAAGIEQSHETRETAIFKNAGFEPLAYFKQRLTEDMAKRGYELKWPASQVETSKTQRDAFGLRKDYAANDEADAQLDVSFDVLGFIAAGAGGDAPFRPTVKVAARLLSKTGKENYFTDYVCYNNVFNVTKAISIEPDQRYVYPKFKDLEAAGPESVEGLKVALDSVAAKIAEQL